MTQENKELLLLKYLCMALPYKVKTLYVEFEMEIRGIDSVSQTVDVIEWEKHRFSAVPIEEIKPYLRSMSSMTEEEVNEYNQCWEEDRDDIMIIGKHFEEMYKSKKFTLYMHPVVPMYRHILWLLKNHFDFMGLIPKGLAIEITENNNPYKE